MIITTYDDTLHHGQVIALWTAVFAPSAAHNEPGLSIDRKIAHDDLLLVAESAGGEVVGTVMAGYDGHRGWIYFLAVRPDHRRRGLGLTLLAHAQNALVRLGCDKINLQMVGDDPALRRFYEAAGFAVEDRVSMGKRL
jgi:ribosomal protein S18 acetylase RimI-like enzyme